MAALDDAAAAALWSLQARPQIDEHLGVIYGNDLQRTPTVTKRRDGSVSGGFTIPAGSLRALFHNHPARRSSRALGHDEPHEFSSKDMMNANRLGVPSYISAGEQIFRYDPATGKTEEVLAQIPLEEIRRLRLADGLKK